MVEAIFDKVLYVQYGLLNGKNTNIRLTQAYKDRAPSLYLNGDGVDQDTYTALELFVKAANLGNTDAYKSLINLYV